METSPDSKIHATEDALWRGLTTITTVGYGDLYPVTPAGRVIAVGLMLTGVGLFDTLSGVTTSFFPGDRKTSHASENDLALELQRLREENQRPREGGGARGVRE